MFMVWLAIPGGHGILKAKGIIQDLDFWPFWLGEELQADGIDVNVWTFGYIAPRSKYSGQGMSLFDQASNLLKYLDIKGIGTRPLIFVTHTMGGLVVKEVINTAQNFYHKEVFIEQTKGIVFLSTPHQGSYLADFIDKFDVLTRTTVNVKELKAHTSQLSKLNEWYTENVEKLGIKTEVFYETQSIKGVLVVDRDSANPGIQGVISNPVASV
uniref:esterase/lipase family protein n=1 Tax=Okeania sp. SIO2F4 TaxID=2607790 RepID=UPI0026014937|nr:hypothetical protein [Okeania sp. SIO2F4]